MIIALYRVEVNSTLRSSVWKTVSRRFVDYREGDLNRHAIQHGVAVGFGTKENFLKLFLFLDFLAEIISYIKCSEPF